MAPTDHFVLESHPKTLHTSFNNVNNEKCILRKSHMHVFWRMQKWLEIACKMGFLLAWKISCLTHPMGRFWSVFFKETFRISYWHLVEQIQTLRSGIEAI
jgi:hypothetical protein